MNVAGTACSVELFNHGRPAVPGYGGGIVVWSLFVCVRRTPWFPRRREGVMIPGLSRTTTRHLLAVYLNGQAAFGFQFPGSNSGKLAWVQVGIRRSTSDSQAAGSNRYRRAVISRL